MYALYEAKRSCTQKEVGDQWSISKQTINSAMKWLEKNGYVALTASETDKRGKYITLTEKGTIFAQKNIAIVFEAEQIAFEQLSETEHIVLIDANQKYLELLQKEMEQYLQK